MGKVVALSMFESLRKVRSTPAGQMPASQVLIFTGVRYERMSSSELETVEEAFPENIAFGGELRPTMGSKRQ